ncbi:MAG: response regulator [Bacteroidetes bacterium]|nr:response regulator [Bacteroidota bacterium]
MERPRLSSEDSSRLLTLLEENLQGHQVVLEQIKALQESEHKYRSILEELDIGYMEVDREGNIIRVHPRFLSITGYREADLLGKNGNVMLDEEGKALMAEIVELRKKGLANSYELPVRHRLGHRIWLLITGAPLKSLSGEVLGSVGIHFDITERKELEMETNRALASEAFARKRERNLLMKMSHEIRTPINAINGMFHLMKDVPRTPEQEALWQGAMRASKMLRQVVDDVLDLSKLEIGQPTVKRTKVNVVEVTSGIAKMHHLLAEEKGVFLNCGCRLEEKRRVIDVDKWLQILTNLLGNAIKFTEKGGVTLDIWEDPQRPDWIFAEVADEGPGIPEALRERIFEPFGLSPGENVFDEVRVDAGTTGLGLSIARELARLLGGDLLLMPSAKGARFVLEMPAPTWVEADKEGSAGAVSDVRDEGGVPLWDGEGMTVLLAEDNEINVLYARALFQRWSVDVDVAADGIEALECLGKRDYDVVLLDVQMPNLDGLATLRRIRSNERATGVASLRPVYMVTAFADDETRQEAEQAGATGFVTKPFGPQVMLDVLKAVRAK